MIVYILITYGGIVIFVMRGVLPYLPSAQIGMTHIIINCILMTSSLSSFLSLMRVNPGKITKSNIKELAKKYPYDGVLFKEAECSACKMQKIARSKHCALCDMCVEKQDHHCIWINGCVGAKNYRLFLWFLLSHAVMCTDISFITTFIYMEIIKKHQLLTAKFVNYRTGQVHTSSWGLVIQYLIGNYPDLLFVLVLCLAMGLALSFFFLFHVSMIWRNQTTNESNKISDMTYHYERTLKKLKEELSHTVSYATKKDAKSTKKEQKTQYRDPKEIAEEIADLEEKMKLLDKNIYDKGVKQNFMEVLFPK